MGYSKRSSILHEEWDDFVHLFSFTLALAQRKKKRIKSKREKKTEVKN